MNDIINLIRMELSMHDSSVVIAVGVGIFIYILEVILYSKGILFASGPKRLELAKQNGYMVTAKRTDLTFDAKDNANGVSTRNWFAVYECDFKGKHHKKYIYSYHGMPASALTLYHDGKSSKLYTETEMKEHRKSFLMIFIPLAVMFAIALLFKS